MSASAGPAVVGAACMGQGARSPPGLLSPVRPFLPHRWVSVLQNSKDEALSSAFNGEPSGGHWSWGSARLDAEPQDLTKMLIAEVKSRPGNGHCCDCGAAGQWGGGEGLVGGVEKGLWAAGFSCVPLQTPRGSAPTSVCSPASSARESTASWACASPAYSLSPWTSWAPASCW